MPKRRLLGLAFVLLCSSLFAAHMLLRSLEDNEFGCYIQRMKLCDTHASAFYRADVVAQYLYVVEFPPVYIYLKLDICVKTKMLFDQGIQFSTSVPCSSSCFVCCSCCYDAYLLFIANSLSLHVPYRYGHVRLRCNEA